MGTSAFAIAISVQLGRVPPNSNVSFSSQFIISVVRSRSFSFTSTPFTIFGVRTLTIKSRLTKSLLAVFTFSTIKRRNSAFTVVVDSPFRVPSVMVTR